MPAGPLREPARRGLARADAVVLLGADRAALAPRLPPPVLLATLAATNGEAVSGRAVVAFAGIGRPAKFFGSLRAAGARLVAQHVFPDHHPYREAELRRLADEATAAGALLVTTAKDQVRLTPLWRDRVAILAVQVAWRDESAIAALLDGVFAGRDPASV
jgi:tetraacyldisaccharide 4'-kinase